MSVNALSKNINGLGVPIVLLILLAMMILPLPPIFLDLFFSFNIALSILILLSSLYCVSPLDFAVFPTILLLSTLLRLALNVASTRVVLLYGHSGAHAAGEVIRAFGEVVIGGNFIVGFVVFTILIIINFVVITKGAGRVSEVTARFTLDAMPGKQMAIDADLNAGLIDQNEAKKRRFEVGQEADFYGAMDGASKFVRGDAVAGILILFINLIGGTLIGIFQHDLMFANALEVYALLTIGDGLVAQIPALILSTASAIMVTRVSSSKDMGTQVYDQVFASSKPLWVASGILSGLGLIPGMPHLAFLGMGLGMGSLAYRLKKQAESIVLAQQDQNRVEGQEKMAALKTTQELKELSWEDVPVVDLIAVEIGYKLISLVDKTQGTDLMTRIKGVRRKLSQDLGFLIPTVHIKDNLELPPHQYQISILGVTVAGSQLYPDKDLAISPGQALGELGGIKTKDPAFGLEAYWIDKVNRDQAQTQGYTVVDASTVLATHLSQVLQEHAHQLIGHQETQKLMENLSKQAPKLVEDLTPKSIPLTVVVKVLQHLLFEKIPVKDIRTIAETLMENASKTQEPLELAQRVRVAMGGFIVQQINSFHQELPVITFSPSLEQILQKSIQNKSQPYFVLEPHLVNRLQASIKECQTKQAMHSQPMVIIVSSVLRYPLFLFIKNLFQHVSVLSFEEIPQEKQIKIIATIGEK